MKIKNKLARIDVAGLTVTVKPKGTSWSINYRQDGKRVRKQVGTEEERDKLVAELRAKRNNLNEAEIHEARHGGAVALSRRTEADRTALLTALQVIEGAGGKPTDLLRAAERYVTTVLQVRQSVTLGTAVNAYTESKQNRRARTKSDIKCRLKQIVKHFGAEIDLGAIEGDAVLSWLRETLGVKARTFNIYRQHVRSLFKFAIAKKWILTSPVAEIEPDTEEHGVPVTLSPAEVKLLMLTAVEKFPALVAYIAIGVFAGLRPERELGCLPWSSVDLDNARITVSAGNAKHRRARNVPLSDNAVEWLRRYAPRDHTGRVFYSRRKLRALLKVAGVTWGQDIMRHSYASYLLAQSEDEALVSARMGNSVAMVRTHYNGARNAKEASAFWAIKPPDSGIIKFPKVEAA